jgi:hypothetical protein
MTVGGANACPQIIMMGPLYRLPWLLPLLTIAAASLDAEARTVHRCMRDGTPSLSTAPEPGSRCEAIEIDDDDPRQPNLWGALGEIKGTLYRREQDGRTVYGTRELPGSEPVLAFTARTPEPPRAAASAIGRPRLDAFADQFRTISRATGVEDAWLRAIAHAESDFDPAAVSPKGAQGIMQLMPATAAEYGVSDPFASEQSIRAGAIHLRGLMQRYEGDLSLVAAAYNAGVGALARHGGVPPYPETQAYVARVLALHERYRAALGGPSGIGSALLH